MPNLYTPEDNAIFLRLHVGTAEIEEGKEAELTIHGGNNAPIIQYDGYTVVFGWQELIGKAIEMIDEAKKESNAATSDSEQN